MEEKAQHYSQRYVIARTQHPAWVLLASRRAPLVLGCLRALFERSHDGIAMEEALQALSDMLGAYASEDLYKIDPQTTHLQAGRELRLWIKQRLIVERDGRIHATDALSSAFQFADGLDNRIMTSTASRLSVVQREIENLDIHLNPNPDSRIATLERRIADLDQQLQEARAGHIRLFDEAQAVEGIREVFNLATSLRSDFRRVEDSWREADRALRQSIISDQAHRGEIVDRLLDGQDELLKTSEGRVFDSFQQQLRQSDELSLMRDRLRNILAHPAAPKALNRGQHRELRWLALRLVKESQAVLQARARSEQDVRGFMKTGLAAEHHRVGHLLSEFFTLALGLDWQRQALRRQPVCLPPVGVAIVGVPSIQRMRFKSLEQAPGNELDMSLKPVTLGQIDDDFWDAFDGLDREALIRQTLAMLAEQGRPLSLGELAQLLPPSHDLETFALWLSMAREVGLQIVAEQRQSVELVDKDARRWRFDLPYVELDNSTMKDATWEL